MQAQKDPKTTSQKRTRIIVLKSALALLVVLILSVVFFVPAFVSSEKGRKTILTKINSTIAGQTDFAGISMSWRKGIKITDFSFNDKTGQISVAARQITTKPHYASIFTGSLSFGETIIDEPKVKINLTNQQEKENNAPRQEGPADKKQDVIILPINKIDLVINDGSLEVTKHKETVKLSQINSRLNLRQPGKNTTFETDMTIANNAKGSKIHAEGQIKPSKKTGWTLKGTSGDLTIEVNDLDLGALGPILTLAGIDAQIEGLVSADIKSEIKGGRLESLNAKVKCKDLDVTASQLKGDRLKSSVFEIDVKLISRQELINIEQLEVHCDWLDVRAKGVVPTTFKSLAEFVKADSAYNLNGSFECDLAAALSQLSNTLGVKKGIKITSGQLSGNIGTSTRNGRREIYGWASLAGLKGLIRERPIALTEPVRAVVEITSDKTGIKYDKLDLSASFCKFNCTGSSELLKYTADVDLAKLQSELGQFIDMGKYRMAGELSSTGAISGSKDKIIATGAGVIKNLRLSLKEGASAFEPRTDIDFSVTIEPEKGVLNVDFIKANTSFGKIGIRDSILPLNKGRKTPMKLAIRADEVDLYKLRPFAVAFVSFPKQMQLAGIAESDIFVNSEKDIYKIRADTTIKNLKINYPEQKPFEQSQVSLIFDGEVNSADKTINIKNLQLISPQIKIRKGQLSQVRKGEKTKLKGQVDCEYDWSAISTVAGPFLPKGLKIEGQRKDTISFVSQYPAGRIDKLLANLNAKAGLGFERAEYMGLNFGPTEVDIQIQNGLLKIAPFSTTVNNGQFNFAGEIDFKQKPTLLRTPGPIEIMKDIHINDTTTKKLLMHMNPVFANAVNVSGIANFSCEKLAIPLAGATKNDLEVIGIISVNELRLQSSDLLGQILSLAGAGAGGQDITIHPTRFVLQNGYLRYDDMQMDVGNNPVNFRGVIGLDKSLDMTVTLPYTTRGRTARVGKETEGKRISLPLKGTVDKPEIDVGKLLEEQFKQQLEEKLREGLDKLFK